MSDTPVNQDWLNKRLRAAEATVAEQVKTLERMTSFLEAFVVAYKEPDGGPWFKLRAFAESQGIYADDLGRDRILLRIAQAALGEQVER